jgi:hypothetical protein
MLLDNFKIREKFIKRIIFWCVVIAGILAFVFNPIKVKSLDFYSLQNIPISSQSNEAYDPCKELGGCVWQINKYNQGTTLERVSRLIFDIIYFLIFLAGAIAVAMLVYGAFLILTTPGNPDGFKNGLNTVINAVLGLVFIILSFTIVNIIQEIISNLKI